MSIEAAGARLPQRWTHAMVDLGAVVHNVEVLRRAVAPAAVWAVVKADAYGHGAVEVTAPRSAQVLPGCASRWWRRRSSSATPASRPRCCC